MALVQQEEAPNFLVKEPFLVPRGNLKERLDQGHGHGHHYHHHLHHDHHHNHRLCENLHGKGGVAEDVLVLHIVVEHEDVDGGIREVVDTHGLGDFLLVAYLVVAEAGDTVLEGLEGGSAGGGPGGGPGVLFFEPFLGGLFDADPEVFLGFRKRLHSGRDVITCSSSRCGHDSFVSCSGGSRSLLVPHDVLIGLTRPLALKVCELMSYNSR